MVGLLVHMGLAVGLAVGEIVGLTVGLTVGDVVHGAHSRARSQCMGGLVGQAVGADRSSRRAAGRGYNSGRCGRADREAIPVALTVELAPARTHGRNPKKPSMRSYLGTRSFKRNDLIYIIAGSRAPIS